MINNKIKQTISGIDLSFRHVLQWICMEYTCLMDSRVGSIQLLCIFLFFNELLCIFNWTKEIWGIWVWDLQISEAYCFHVTITIDWIGPCTLLMVWFTSFPIVHCVVELSANLGSIKPGMHYKSIGTWTSQMPMLQVRHLVWHSSTWKIEV